MRITLYCLAIFSFFILLPFSGNAQSPKWEWVYPDSTYRGRNILETDAAGNIYSTGCGLSKHSAAGVLLWSKFRNAVLTGLSKDATGNLYITGTFQNIIRFDSIALATQPGTICMFIANINPNGKVIWAKKGLWGSNIGPDDGAFLDISGVSTDAAGNSLVSGMTWGEAVFDSITLPATLPEVTPFSFAAMYDKNGNVKWARKQNYGRKVETGPYSSYYQTDYDFIRKYSENGSLLWQKWFSSLSSNWQSASYQYLTVDQEGNCYATGILYNHTIFDGDTLQASGQGNIFLIKYSNTGKKVWAKTIDALSDSSASFSRSIYVSKSGQLYLTGSFRGSVSLGGSTNLHSGVNIIQRFVAKLSATDGKPYWTKQIMGNVILDIVTELPNGEVVTAGSYFKKGCLFDDILLADKPNSTSKNIFLAKLSAVSVNQPTADPLKPRLVYPNPASKEVTIEAAFSGKGSVAVYNLAGQRIFTAEVPEEKALTLKVADWPAGLYLVKINTEGKALIQKLLVRH